MTPKVRVLHVGAHRTGTTALQFFLQQNARAFAESGVRTLYPPTTRSGSAPWIGDNCHTIVSEENFLGTMENNIWRQSLYEDASAQLRKYSDFTGDPTIVLFSVRNYADYWRSAVQFCVQKRISIPPPDFFEAVSVSERTWVDVIDDIRDTFPKASVIVREFGWKTNNPKQFLLRGTGLQELKIGQIDRRRHNASPATSKLISTLISRGDDESLKRIDQDPDLRLFGLEQMRRLSERYFEDIEILSERDDITLLCDKDGLKKEIEVELQEASNSRRRTQSEATTTCILHIGKGGADDFRKLVGERALSEKGIVFCSHNETLTSTIEKYGPDRKLVLFYRDPVERFVASFQARLRQGRPDYDTDWFVGEAVAFSFFDTANGLAEALEGKDERLYSAARFAFDQIQHLRLNYRHYLLSSVGLNREMTAGRIVECVEYGKQSLDRVASRLGLKVQGSASRPNQEPLSEISASGKKALEDFWADEFSIYRTLSEIEDALANR